MIRVPSVCAIPVLTNGEHMKIAQFVSTLGVPLTKMMLIMMETAILKIREIVMIQIEPFIPVPMKSAEMV